MTICVGFDCRDGLVVAADRQQTFLGSHTFQECKLRSTKWKNGRAIWGYSGNYDTAKTVWEKVDERFALSQTVTQAEVKSALSEVLAGSLKETDEFYVLFGAWTEGEDKALFLSSGTDVMYAGRCEIIGAGDSSLSRFFRGLYLTAIPAPSVWQAAIAAIYFVNQEKKYNGQYVGGGTDVFMAIGSAQELVRVMAPEHCEPWEKQMDELEWRFVELLTGVTSKNREPEFVAESRRRFDSTLNEVAEKMTGSVLK